MFLERIIFQGRGMMTAENQARVVLFKSLL